MYLATTSFTQYLHNVQSNCNCCQANPFHRLIANSTTCPVTLSWCHIIQLVITTYCVNFPWLLQMWNIYISKMYFRPGRMAVSDWMRSIRAIRGTPLAECSAPAVNGELIGSTDITMPRTMMHLASFEVGTIRHWSTICRCDMSHHTIQWTPSHTPTHTRLLEHTPPYNKLWTLVFKKGTNDEYVHFLLSSGCQHCHGEASQQAKQLPRTLPYFWQRPLDLTYTVWETTISDNCDTQWVRLRSPSPSSMAWTMHNGQPR
jgi:hypothetical protein